jgi:hypothetical protein
MSAIIPSHAGPDAVLKMAENLGFHYKVAMANEEKMRIFKKS